ncbi:MAG: hypothetical protein ACTSUR_07195, partial [Candidatus Heimdallarchaeaceae archaeon]
FTGKISNYYKLGGKKNALVAVNKKSIHLLVEKENRVQYVTINEPIFFKIIEFIFTISSENRIITEEIIELSGKEKILYVDSVKSSTGVVTGQHGILWITDRRFFIHISGRDPYARPLSTIDTCVVTPDNKILLIVKTLDGRKEYTEVETSSEPGLVQNIVEFVKKTL